MAKRAQPGNSRTPPRRSGRPAPRTRVRQVRSGPPPPVPALIQSPPVLKPALGPAPEAVVLFERGMEALQRHAYPAAAESFRTLVERFESERALLDRARVYLDLCARELRKRPAPPRTIEERLTAATAALNNGDASRAEQLAKSVLAEDARQDLALYLLAVIEARRGASAAALGRLREAITLSPDAGAQARIDADFESLHDEDAFWKLTEPPQNHHSQARRPRRPRPER